MSNNKINVFVKLDMNGNKSQAFNLEPDSTVSNLIQLIKDREGTQVGDVRLMKGARPMRLKNNAGTAMKLSDYNCYNNCTLFASLRLIGGAVDPTAEGVNARRFNTDNVVKLGGTLAIKKRAPNGQILEYTNCTMYMSDGCGESLIPKAKLSCPCTFCADCMKINLDQIIKIGGGITITCGSTAHGDHKLDDALAYEIAAFTENEKKEKDEILGKNYFKRSDSEMSVCPNGKCNRFVYRDENDNRVKMQCTACQKYICWWCKDEFKGDAWCGNDDCNPVGQLQQMIELGQMKTISSTKGVKQCWDTRLCPIKGCTAVNGHNSNCEKVLCGVCNTRYCHLCLGIWDKECSYPSKGLHKNCTVKPKQTITKADVPGLK